ncbi:MFS transporter [Sulfurospirillum diekertiae]|uniref:Multidrug resistance protein MdtG n=1 Tax=Sulfurospirillum diekertiae TaxID=1854492 RepID=A0A1Y0HJB5_9BACT|nr:MFS transporter [Sulfurospirillum diekertiae]ARU48191.1 Multidrug resistance protein MdtG [Sulfurospirillum diekertiae]ASC93034.1 Multidrug resistance protein MdtG [Sulfurospirillum diekertiae]
MEDINKNIVALGVNSFFTDFATEMILPLLPLFLERFLHATKSDIGMIEGFAELGVAMLIAFSGFLSDKLGHRKMLTIIGYGFSNLIKPLAYFASSALMVGMVRVGDRFGKGVRTAPRDALISAFTPSHRSGFVFGFHKMMDSAGAIAGSLTAFLCLQFYGESETTFRFVFALSFVPGVLAVLILIVFVSDVRAEPIPFRSFRPFALSKEFYMLVAFQVAFSLVAMNYSFMVLKSGDNGLALMMIPLAYTLYNATQSFFAIPIGKIADRVGKPLMLSLIYTIFGLSAWIMTWQTPMSAWIAFGSYGVFAAGFNALAKAIISDTTPKALKASAYGIYYGCVGIATFISLAMAGYIWDHYDAQVLFQGVAIGAISLAVILFFFRKILTIKIEK